MPALLWCLSSLESHRSAAPVNNNMPEVRTHDVRGRIQVERLGEAESYNIQGLLREMISVL